MQDVNNEIIEILVEYMRNLASDEKYAAQAGHVGSGEWRPDAHAVVRQNKEALRFFIDQGYPVNSCNTSDCSQALCLTCDTPTRDTLKRAPDYDGACCGLTKLCCCCC